VSPLEADAHARCADVIEAACITAHGTEYIDWPLQDFVDYAEHRMLALAAMTDEQIAARFVDEPSPRKARDEDLVYWTAVVARGRR
jgi:hypothetical protein